MLVIYPFSTPDQEQALKNAKWIAELGDYKGHDIFILSDRRCDPAIVKEIVSALTKVFRLVQHRQTQSDIDGWPQGANHMFGYATALIQHTKEWPYFLWLEPDAIPIHSIWLDALDAEYERGKKPFMGEKVDLGEKRPDVPVHMSGVGIYQNPIYMLAGEAYRAHEVAWDIAAKDQILPHCHFTKLIQHYWRHGTFTSLDGLRPETLIFHSSKDGSLIDLLRNENLHTDGSPAQAKAQNETLQKGLAGQAPGGGQGHVPPPRQETQAPQTSQISGEGRAGEGSAIRKNHQAEGVQPMQGSDASETTARTPQGLRQAAGSGVDLPDVPLAGTQSTIKILPHNGIWVLEGDTIISDMVEREGRLDFDSLIPHIIPLIRPGDTVVDVGAFIGDHTVAYSHAVGKAGKVIAYEPHPLAFQCLVHNTQKFGNVFTFGRALGNEDGIVTITDLANAASNYVDGSGPMTVNVRPLDADASLFGQLDLIKIDVEGYELNVLKGAEQLINKFHPKMVVEINEIALKRQNVTAEDIVAWIVRHGYAVSILHRHKDAPFYDILAVANTPEKRTDALAHTLPHASAPVAIPELTPEICINFLKKFAGESWKQKASVMQKLVYAGLRPTNKEKKPNGRKSKAKADNWIGKQPAKKHPTGRPVGLPANPEEVLKPVEKAISKSIKQGPESQDTGSPV